MIIVYVNVPLGSLHLAPLAKHHINDMISNQLNMNDSNGSFPLPSVNWHARHKMIKG